MKKSVKTLLILLLAVFAFGTTNVFADDISASGSTITTGGKYIYSSRETDTIESVEGVTYQPATHKLILENADLTDLVIENHMVYIELKGSSTIEKNLFIGCANIVFTGDGFLAIKGTGLESYSSTIYTNGEEVTSDLSYPPRVQFRMTGTVTAMKGIGGYRDDSLAANQNLANYTSIQLGENVAIIEGGSIKSDGAQTFIGGEDTTTSNYNQVKVVIQGGQTPTPTPTPSPTPEIPGGDEGSGDIGWGSTPDDEYTITNGDTSFTSKDELDPGYSLTIEDKKSALSKEATTLLEKAVANSHLVLLYNISVVNGSGNVVSMRNGEYTIRLKLSAEDLKNYDTFTAIFVDENGEVKETFDTKIDGEYVEFTTTHLSDYGILGSHNPGAKNPSTNDNGMIILSIVGGSLLGVVVTSNSLRKRFER